MIEIKALSFFQGNLQNNDQITDFCNRLLTTQEFSKLWSGNFNAKLAQANLASKNDIVNFLKKTDLNKDE